MNEKAFTKLVEYLEKIPAIRKGVSSGSDKEGHWWVKFNIDINHEFAWHVVQELGHVLNYMSLNERLPTSFHPVSPPPHMNGGPEDFLSWVIECHDSKFRPGTCAEWLIGRLPNPVEDLSQWNIQ